MFIDFVTLLLVNMSTGFFLIAAYVGRGMDDADKRPWSLPFFAVGLVALVFGAYMVMTWPLPKQFNSAFGECSVLFGVTFLMAGLGLALNWRLSFIAGYAIPAGLAAIVFGIRIVTMGLTAGPIPAGFGFIASGLAAFVALPTVTVLRKVMPWRVFAAVIAFGIGCLWLGTGLMGIWGHMESFAAWAPTAMRK